MLVLECGVWSWFSGCPQTEVNERWSGLAKENLKIQSPGRRRNHFINASFVREHGQDIVSTWPGHGHCHTAYAICDRHSPKANAPAPSKRKLSPRRAQNFARNLPPGCNNVSQSWKSWLFFARSVGPKRRGLQSVSSTLNNDFYRCDASS